MADEDPRVSFVVPALDEESYLPTALRSIAALDTSVDFEVLVVDGGSSDGTRAVARSHDVTLVEQPGSGGIGAGRDLGARRASGDWLAFVDADTRVRPSYLDAMLSSVTDRGLAAASSRCRVTGPYRGKAMQVVINRVFPHLRRPVLPGFNFVVDSDVYAESGGFPDVGNEDTAFSRRLAREYDTGYHPDVLVETSGRRFAERGLTGALVHYVRLDLARVSSGE
jgi:glycosyltransferase involved in cell wall biosynthesis